MARFIARFSRITTSNVGSEWPLCFTSIIARTLVMRTDINQSIAATSKMRAAVLAPGQPRHGTGSPGISTSRLSDARAACA